MPDLEPRISTALDGVPAAPEEVRQRVLRSALDALPTPAPTRRVRPWRLVALAGGAALAGGGAVAAVGDLVSRSPAPEPTPAPTRLTIPAGTEGVGVLADGRAWLAMRNGLRVEGMPASALEISPGALFAAVGLGRSLVVLAPGGRRAWTVQTAGTVRRIVWRPDGLEIAYVVERGGRRELRVIEADGDHDRRLVAPVAPVAPAWSADSIGVSYLDSARERRMRAAASGEPIAARLLAPPGPSLRGRFDGASLVIEAPTSDGVSLIGRVPVGRTTRPVTLIRRG